MAKARASDGEDDRSVLACVDDGCTCTQEELQALRAENGGYRRKLETTMQRLELAMQQVRLSAARA